MIYDFIYGIIIGSVSTGLIMYFLPNIHKKDGLYIAFYWHRVRIELSPDEIVDLIATGYTSVSSFITSAMDRIYTKALEKKAEKEKDKEKK